VTAAAQRQAGAEAGALLEATDVVKHYVTSAGAVRAVDGVSFTIRRGEVLGLVGESGCGKSTLGRTVMGLEEADGGSVRLDGSELVGLSRRQLRPHRRHVQMIFQDPFGSLNPRSTVQRLLTEPFEVHGIGTRAQRRQWAAELLQRVGLRPEHAFRYPHEFSGGQRQRISIARAIALQPKLVVCDEAVSALDVSVQAQIVNLLRSLQREAGLAYLFISHDLGVVGHLSDHIAVMYLGRIVEMGAKGSVLRQPLHPYTKALFSAVPGVSMASRSVGERRRPALAGEPPSPLNPPQGCRFHTRCPMAVDRCRVESPSLRQIAPDHKAACHLV
jgi:oligopeptide/dipeptide ABC transporter ATP-binding protein